jgi:hypothetical protein
LNNNQLGYEEAQRVFLQAQNITLKNNQ